MLPLPSPHRSGRSCSSGHDRGHRLGQLAAIAVLGSLSVGLVRVHAAETPAASPASANAIAGAKGAQVYCFMRGTGNSHDVSWTAAYALIKRQSDSLFKTSPEHAAVMITEAVVQNPGSYPDCGQYLGSLFEKAAARDAAAAAAAAASTEAKPAGTGKRPSGN